MRITLMDLVFSRVSVVGTAAPMGRTSTTSLGLACDVGGRYEVQHRDPTERSANS